MNAQNTKTLESSKQPAITVKHFSGLQTYQDIWQAMHTFTSTRNEHTLDEIWCLQHHPVFTQGQAGKAEHILAPGAIPVVQTDRGGQVTYHGPGQLVVYFLLDLRRRKLTIRDLVCKLEKSVILLLKDHYALDAYGDRTAPGIYIAQQKICSIGLRVRRGASYHGISFNIDMDLTPFHRINPCGFKGLKMTQLADWVDAPIHWETLNTQLLDKLFYQLEASTL